MHGGVASIKPVLLFEIPALMMAINNYFTAWTPITSLSFISLAALGFIIHRVAKNSMYCDVQSIEVSPDLKNFYLSVPQSFKASIIQN